MGNEDYKQGYADSMKAHEDFLKKQEAATQHIAGEMAKVGEDVGRLGEKISGITDYITDQEKVELYKLNAPVDIAELEARDKELLWAVLYQLANDEDEITEEQQNYLRAVQNYIGVKDAQVESLDVIEEINDVDTSKAILQAVLEFFYLGTHFGDYTEKQTDFLDLFNVNPKGRKEILNHIETIVKAVGIKGLAEKYGFVPAPEPEMESENMQREPGCSVDPAELQDVSIDTILSIPEGETVTYRNKRICVKSYISCDGTLEFINCIIEYGGELGGNVLTVNSNGNVRFDYCSFDVSGKKDSYFICCEEESSCEITNSLLDNCSFFLISNYHSSELVVKRCFIHNPKEHTIGTLQYSQIKDTKILFSKCYQKIEGTVFFLTGIVENCVIECSEDARVGGATIFMSIKKYGLTFNHCSFARLGGCISGAAVVKNCAFTECGGVITNTSEISDCIFQGGTSLVDSVYTIRDSQFIGCRNSIIDLYCCKDDPTYRISYCTFSSLESSGNIFEGAIMIRGEPNAHCHVEHCIFTGITLKGKYYSLIASSVQKKLKQPFVEIHECTFKGCTAEREDNVIVEPYAKLTKILGKIDFTRTISISKCAGLNVDGTADIQKCGKPISDSQMRTTTKDGSGIIGAALDLVASHPVASIIGGSVIGGPVGGLAAGSALLINKIKKD